MLYRGVPETLRDYVAGWVRHTLTTQFVISDHYNSLSLHSRGGAPGPKLSDLDWQFNIELTGIRCNLAPDDAKLTQLLQERLVPRLKYPQLNMRFGAESRL
jgi:hypothetical protein